MPLKQINKISQVKDFCVSQEIRHFLEKWDINLASGTPEFNSLLHDLLPLIKESLSEQIMNTFSG